MDKSDYYVMGIDLGTQSARVGIFDNHGRYISGASKEYDTIFPEVGWAEQNPNDWWEALKYVLSEIAKEVEVSMVKGIVACATSSTVVAVNEKGEALMNALMWMDIRSKSQAARINSQKHKILKLCGGEVSAEWMVPKALWIKEEKNEIYKQSFKIIEQLDWLNYKLTGKWAASVCNTTCKWNLGPDKKWDMDYLNSVGLEDITDKWPQDIKIVGELIGSLTSRAAFELGLNEDTLVFEGAIDAYVSVFGMGIAEKGKLSLTMGTSFVHLTFEDKELHSDALWGPYKDVLMEGYWVLEAGQISGASVIEWFKKEFVGDYRGRKNVFNYMADKGAEIPPGSEGVIALDFFQGNRTPYKDALAKGVFYGLNLKHTKWHIYRSILEATAFGNLNNINEIEKSGSEISEIVVGGGATRHNLWPQIIADVCNRPIKIPENSASGILGCAIIALKGIGEYDGFCQACSDVVKIKKIIYPNNDNYKIYRKIFDKYLYLYENLKDLMHDGT